MKLKQLIVYSLFLSLSLVITPHLFGQNPVLQFKKGKKLPEPVCCMAYSGISDGLISFGGVTFTNRETNYVFKYNSKTEKWLNLTRSYDIDPMIYGAATYLGEKYDGVILHGGLSDYGNYVVLLKDISFYDLSKYKMSSLGTNPHPANTQGSSYWEDKLYIFGGSTAVETTKKSRKVNYSQSLVSFDLKTGTIGKLADMPEAKQTNGVIVDGYLYVIGGYNGKASRRVDRYDITNDSWEELDSLADPLSAYAVTQMNQFIFYVGDYQKLNQLLVFDTKTLKHHVFNMNFNARFAGAGLLNGNLHVFGGLDPSQINNKVMDQHWYISMEDIISQIEQ